MKARGTIQRKGIVVSSVPKKNVKSIAFEEDDEESQGNKAKAASLNQSAPESRKKESSVKNNETDQDSDTDDQLESESTTTNKAIKPKKRGRPSLAESKKVPTDVSTSTAKKRRRKSDVIDDVVQVEPEASVLRKKAFYPLIEASSNDIDRLVFESANDGEKEAFVRIMKYVCELEHQGLTTYFQKQYPDKTRLLQSLVSFLQSLPNDILEMTPNDMIFESEYSSDEKSELFELQTLVRNQEEYALKLSGYENDIDSFVKEFNICAAPKPATASITSSTTNKNIELSAGILQSIHTHCDVILKELASTSDVLNDAWKAQDRVYNTFQTLRSQGVTQGRSVPSRPQELIRGLSKM